MVLYFVISQLLNFSGQVVYLGDEIEKHKMTYRTNAEQMRALRAKEKKLVFSTFITIFYRLKVALYFSFTTFSCAETLLCSQNLTTTFLFP